MNPAYTAEPRIDQAILREVLALDAEHAGLLQRLHGHIVRQTAELFAQLDGAPANLDAEGLRRSLHTLKGTAASLGARRLSVIAARAEESTHDRDRDEFDALISALRDESVAVYAELLRISQGAIS
jgi:HPt (histidine-containing phosphotransfer) domain-containing protein